MPACSIQLPKWQSKETIASEKERWIYLFKEGKNVDLDNPPEPLKTEEMKQVMKVLHRFSSNETDYILYQSRLDAVLKENTYISALEEAMRAKEPAVKEKEQQEQQVAKVRRSFVENLLKLKFGNIDESLSLVINPLLKLTPEESSRLIWQTSREALLMKLSH